MDPQRFSYCSDPACDCHTFMTNFFKVNEAIPRLKTSREYPIASRIPPRVPTHIFSPHGSSQRGSMLKKRYPCQNPMMKKKANVGRQVDPCPMSLVQHPKDWDSDTSIPTERDPNLFKQNKRKYLQNVKMI